MTGSVTGLDQHGLVPGMRPEVMVGVGSPMDTILANSGTFFRDFTNDFIYINCTADTAGAGSTWVGLGSTA